MSASRNQRDVHELIAASEHLYYEFGMLDRLAHLLALNAFGNGPVANALLESFAIHARNLLQFFFPKSPHGDDVLAADYFDTPEAWESVRGEMPQELARIAGRVGKEVAHLTYSRLAVSDEAKEWHFLEIATAIKELAEKFTAHARAGTLGARFRAPE